MLASKAGPRATDDTASIDSGWRNREVTIDVLANDSDPYSEGLMVVSAGPAANGTVTINSDNTVTYRRNWRYKDGCETFSYTIRDGQSLTDTAMVQVAIGGTTCAPLPEPEPGPENNPPTANFTHSTSDLTANFTDTSSDGDGSVVGWAWTDRKSVV